MSEWMPIKTAPKDEPILVSLWSYGNPSGRRICVMAEWSFQINAWVEFEPSVPFPAALHTPTHWMPLPPPPNAHNTHPAVNTETTDATDGGEVA